MLPHSLYKNESNLYVSSDDLAFILTPVRITYFDKSMGGGVMNLQISSAEYLGSLVNTV
jgi:hypothetical protein